MSAEIWNTFFCAVKSACVVDDEHAISIQLEAAAESRASIANQQQLFAVGGWAAWCGGVSGSQKFNLWWIKFARASGADALKAFSSGARWHWRYYLASRPLYYLPRVLLERRESFLPRARAEGLLFKFNELVNWCSHTAFAARHSMLCGRMLHTRLAQRGAYILRRSNLAKLVIAKQLLKAADFRKLSTQGCSERYRHAKISPEFLIELQRW